MVCTISQTQLENDNDSYGRSSMQVSAPRSAGPNLRSLIRYALWSACAASVAPLAAMAQTAADNTEVLDTITVTGSSIRTQAAALDTMAQPIQFVSEEQFQNTPAES